MPTLLLRDIPNRPTQRRVLVLNDDTTTETVIGTALINPSGLYTFRLNRAYFPGLPAQEHVLSELELHRLCVRRCTLFTKSVVSV